MNNVTRDRRPKANVPRTSPLVSRRLLGPLRFLWVTTLAGTLVALSLAVPIMYAQGHQLCVHAEWCNGAQLTAPQLRSLHRSGLSLDFYAGYTAAMNLVFGLVYCAIAALIFLRRSQERMALLSSFFLVIFGGLTFPGVPATLASAHPILQVPAGLTQLLGATLISLFFFLFPSGRFVPSWTRWFVPALPLCQAPSALFNNFQTGTNTLTVAGSVGLLATLLLMVGAQIYRYRKVSTPVEQQQTKWVVLGMGIGILMFVVLVTLGIFLPPSFAQSIYSVILPQTVMYAFMLLIPLSIAFAILRSNLWSVDTVINRTLVYLVLTITLAALYILGVVSVQAVLRTVTGQSSELAVAIVTLAIAALFNPWRTRVQRFIDRRFYRRKYDAAQTLAVFQRRVRDDLDLHELREDLLSLIQRTIEPAGASIWLRDDDRKEADA